MTMNAHVAAYYLHKDKTVGGLLNFTAYLTELALEYLNNININKD